MIRDILVSQAKNGYGHTSIDDLARSAAMLPATVSANLRSLEKSKVLESLKIGGKDGQQVFYKLAQ